MITRRSALALPACLCLGFAASLSAAENEKVEYRLAEWKSLHFKDAKQAQSYAKTFKSIGVEFKQESHGDHIDVRFRCPKWRVLTLKTHKEAHQWEDFLKKIGFETKHVH